MADFDEQLNHILSNPEAMAQIAQLAQSLTGSAPMAALSNTPSPSAAASAPAQKPGGSEMLTRLLPLLQELGGQRDSNARQLLYALRPYLKPHRQEKLERALQLARLYHMGKKLLSEWEG